ncbi:MAG: trigger factor [Lachnospiraceae bacterium]|nr:trigger factor [Lachnospiraceae bacterium]
MKRFTLLALLAAAGTLVLSGCGKKEEDMKYLKDFDATKYVTLGEYKGLNVSVPKSEVTDEELQDYIDYLLSANKENKEITDRDVAKDGDIANIDYVGKKDGIAFDGGTATGFDLTLGSGVLVEGFEDGVVGMKVGETKDLNLTFPDSYANEDLAGADVVFTVTLNSIKEAIIPELTDEYVKSLGTGLNTVQEYKDDIKQTMLDSKESDRDSAIEQSISDQVIGGATINGAPSGFKDRIAKTMLDEITETAADAGVEPGLVASYYYGVSEDNYEAELRTFIEENLLPNYMVFGAIADKEGIKVSDEDMDADIQKLIEDNGATITVEEYKTNLGDNLEDYREYLLILKVMEFLKENAVITEE